MTDSPAVSRRHDFVLYFDVKNGNPNGDPDAGNMPRMDPETGCGLVSDVCLKRKVRNFIELANEGQPRFGIYVTEGAVLNDKHRMAYVAVRPDDKEVKTAKKLTPKSDEEALALRRFMCDNFYDIRAFGGVLSTGINCGQVRGPIQLTFAESVEPVLPLEISITRMAATSEKEQKDRIEGSDDAEEKRGDKRTMGRKHIIPYGLYRVHGFVSAPLASHPVKGTGFTLDDLEMFWLALENMFENDHSAARGEMNTRRLVIFRHASALGNAPSHTLFDRVTAQRVHMGSPLPIGSAGTDNWPPARNWSDYQVTADLDGLPPGVEIIER